LRCFYKFIKYMDQELAGKFEEQNRKLDAIELSVKKIRSYLFWTMMASVILFILPLIGLLIVIPQFLKMYSSLGV